MSLNKKVLSLIMTSMLTISMIGCTPKTGSKEEDSETDVGEKVVTIYTDSDYKAEEELYRGFEADTGIKINVVQGSTDELIEQMKKEGKDSEADLLVSKDVANLYKAIDEDLVQPIQSPKIDENVDPKYKSNDNNWVGLSKSAQVIAYIDENIDVSEISSYEDLADEKYKNTLLLPEVDPSYNNSLISSIVSLEGEEKATDWLNNIKDNLAREPEGKDKDQLMALVEEQGKLAIVNTYNVASALNSPEDKEKYKNLKVIFPEETHMNISGVVLNKNSKNVDSAIRFVEYMTDDKAQTLLTQETNQYPINKRVEYNETLKSLGEFKEQEIDFTKLRESNKKSTEIIEEMN